MMTFAEQPVVFDCDGDPLLGIVSLPAAPAARGVLIVVGGPQYRVGSSRQFTLLARHLAACGVPVMRFDYRGMGDSGGEKRSFERVDTDLRCAMAAFMNAVPALKEVAIWGLCDGASAALFYAHQDERVTGIVLVNPWVHTEREEARTFLRHYYLQRLTQGSFWRKILEGQFNVGSALRSFGQFVAAAISGKSSGGKSSGAPAAGHAASQLTEEGPLPERMEAGLHRFKGSVLLVLSGNDLVALEFKSVAESFGRWRKLLAGKRVSRRELPGANHTFARREWRDQVARWTEEWLKSY